MNGGIQSPVPARADVVVVGAGPAGAAAAAWAARSGRDVLLVDSSEFPRDKPCGDALTPRCVSELLQLGLGDWLSTRLKHQGIKLLGFGGRVDIDYPEPAPLFGTAIARTILDDRVRQVAVDEGCRTVLGMKVVDAVRDSTGRVAAVVLSGPSGAHQVQCEHVIVADGARSSFGRILGRQWHQDTVYGVAARAYIESPRSEEPWLSMYFELRSVENAVLPGYGWAFPLGSGLVNVGVGSLATAKRPADLNMRRVLEHFVTTKQSEWGFSSAPRDIASALLPMGGAVSGLAGPNWMLVGDAAACVNPLNGEGIDYALESGRLAAGLLSSGDLTEAWPQLLQQKYGRSFSVARRMALMITVPQLLPIGGAVMMKSSRMMNVFVRLQGNLVTDDDVDLVARLWRGLGVASQRVDQRRPFS
ncbi:geranylgeranyl reductase family protein [Mycolicibacterium farcinogenes]|uniref:geranylgeranyl reductase family protein n=1 Tax=Mycolicibacterium farcinogenes TaxID=1802 RepID=UPI001C8DDFA8|nr:geranylgeranyl reductase family protein [Mycolicibacterium farcinogenes]QZH59722.1 geranylgeranyl reductase family protein [Mycolicibacterium farcinogenes]